MGATAIILAAGEGTRMKSNHAKVAHCILGKPMIEWVIDAALAAGCMRVMVVVGSHADEVRALVSAAYGNRHGVVETIEQRERLGTAHAVQIALHALDLMPATGTCDPTGATPPQPLMVLNGDTPLIQPTTIARMIDAVASARAACSILTMTPPDPFGYGRIVLDQNGEVKRVIEQKDCSEKQSATLRECNAGCYAFDSEKLARHICEVRRNNAQGEYYLPDMVEILKQAGARVSVCHADDYTNGLGVNSRAQLAELASIARQRINSTLMNEGVSFIDPAQAWISPDAHIGQDTVIWPQTHVLGRCEIGESCQIGPNTRLTNTRVGSHCIVDETVALEAQLEDGVSCGPRAYLRPGTHMLEGSKAGTHVEIKDSTIGKGSKVPHLSYIGDATMGEDVNIGAGSITCNYDGTSKHPTTIGDRTFVGSDTMMVAPVHIGDDVMIGAGSCITKDVESGSLAVERAPQRIIADYTARKGRCK